MIIKKAQYKKCKCCGASKFVKDEVIGCDSCRAEINLNKEGSVYLEVTVFSSEGVDKSYSLKYCSWKCVLKELPKLKSDYFVTLPYLQFGSGKGKTSAFEFFKLMNLRDAK